MTSSEESRLDSALRRGLKGIEGLPESARFADENITKYLRQKLDVLLLREYRRRFRGVEDEVSMAQRTARMTDDAVLDAQKMYSLFQLYMNKQLDEFWKGLRPEAGVRRAEAPATDPEKATFTGSYSTDTPGTIADRRFHCIEGCVFEGESAYFSHRDRGHHPVPG